MSRAMIQFSFNGILIFKLIDLEKIFWLISLSDSVTAENSPKNSDVSKFSYALDHTSCCNFFLLNFPIDLSKLY